MTIAKIDKRKKYILVLDVETAGDVAKNPLVYDIGGAITDRKGNIYETFSFLVTEIFADDALMRSAYYASKIPLYHLKLERGEIELKDFRSIKWYITNLIDKYKVKEIGAYNSTFDFKALNNTYNELFNYPYFFEYRHNQLKKICIWHIATQTIFLQKTFPSWAIENGFYSKSGNIKTSAEIAYRWINKDTDFIEEHTGYADVLIEVEILAHCLKQNKKMKKGLNSYCWKIPQMFHKQKIYDLGMDELKKLVTA